MKLNYYGFCLYNNKDESNIKFNLNKLMTAYCNGAGNDLKNSVEYNGDKLFLLKRTKNIYLFVTTRDNEIVKKINTKEVTVEELTKLFEKDEKLGYSSYIHIGENFLSIASTLFAPKIKAFTTFTNKLLTTINHNNLALNINALLHVATKQEALAFPVVSAAKLRVDHDSSHHEKLKGLLCGEDDGGTDIDCFEVRIIPKRGKDVTKSFRKMIKTLPKEGVQQLTVRARGTLDDIMTDYYLAGQGILSDQISSKDEHDILEEIDFRIKENALAKNKTDEFLISEECQDVVIQSLIPYFNTNTWTNTTLDI